nr:Protein of unknown function C6 domain containing protein [Haemonchus contortus]
MYAYVNLQSTQVDGAVCDRDSQLVWKTIDGQTYGKTLQATCAFPCATCTSLTPVTTPCPVNYDCSNTGIEEPLTYSVDSRGCTSVTCTVGQMFNSGQKLEKATCRDGDFVVATTTVTQVACGLPCNTCTKLTNTGLTCPTGHTCTTVSQRAGQCPEAYCPAGIMTADGVVVDTLKCNTQGQWVDATGTVYTAAQCELSCDLCTALTNDGMPCPTGLICEPATEREGTCKEMYCPEGDMTGNTERTGLTSLTCSGGSVWIDGLDTVYTSAQCEIRCDQCSALTNNGMTCPTGFVCEEVTLQAGQCPTMACTTGTMKANPGNVEVDSLTCDGSAQWVDDQETVFTAAQCELPCTECTALSNTGMDCPKGFICEVATTREGQCSELFCETGSLTGNTERTPLTLLTCNGDGEWIDTQDVAYTLAQCETPCDKCQALTNTGMTCPTGSVCTPVTINTDGQCPVASCAAGTMTAGDGRTTVTSLSCNGEAQWIDAQGTVYTKAQCEKACTDCPALQNTGMDCPKGFVCEAPKEREGQCSETYCETGSLTGNTGRTPLTLLTCNTEAKWVDTQDVTYTVAQCETPCDQCPALTNTGMTCLSGFVCTPVTINNDGQCPTASCATGLMTAGDGRTTVTSLSCNGLAQWIDAEQTVYTKAQCETGCTCPPLPISPAPRLEPNARGNPLGVDANGCSILTQQCTQNDLYRLVTDNGIVTLQPPAARNTQMKCVGGEWKATINGVETTVREQACYIAFTCTFCGDVNPGPGVTVTLEYDPTTWCKKYTLSGCPQGYRIGQNLITDVLTCDRLLRWTSGSYNSRPTQGVTVNCRQVASG